MEIVATRKDFIDVYVGWSYKKTTKFLQENINNKIIVDESEGPLYIDGYDVFGMEAIIAIKNFGSKTNFLNFRGKFKFLNDEDKLVYYFNLTPNRLSDLFQK
jgi:hypothetical protein